MATAKLESDGDGDDETPFTRSVQAAKSGLRRDVQAVIDALDASELVVPLAQLVSDAPEGESVELESDFRLVAHLLPDTEGNLFSVLFTNPALLDPLVDALRWTTDGEELRICTVPARIALQMAHDAIDQQSVFGLVIDPAAPSELCLSREEIGSILRGRAVPLIGYVGDIPSDERERTLLAEPADPPPADLTQALHAFIGQNPEIAEHRLQRTFNPDRDLEPHLTLTLRLTDVSDTAARDRIFRGVTAALEGKLPPPGYLDVLFES